LRIDLYVDVHTLTVGARGNRGVATAIGCGNDPVWTSLELNLIAFVYVLLPANIRATAVRTAALLTRTERGKVRYAASCEFDISRSDPTGAGLVCYGNPISQLGPRTVPIDTHPNPIGGRIGIGVDANQLYLPPHEVTSIEGCRPDEE
jgi:hypothetical protein